MISKFVSVGDKIELQPVIREEDSFQEEKSKTYFSQVQEVISEDTLEILMPMEQSKLVLLPVDYEYDITFYTSNGLYQCFARIIDRYKSNNIYILVAELTSNLRKFQRREFYRFSCALEMCARTLERNEVEAIEERRPYVLQPGLPLKRSVIVDISGGGLRFMSSQRYEPESLLYCSYDLLKNGERKKYEVVGKVLGVKELDNRPGTFEHRVQYYNLSEGTREEIIKFIFEAERKSRRNEHDR